MSDTAAGAKPSIMSRLRAAEAPAAPWRISLAAGFFFAALAILTMASPINHFGTIDPLLYQSYIHNYKELIELYGYTYYSNRIAWIFPAHLAHALLGDMPGYYAIRILIMGSAATAFSIMVNRFCRWQFGVYAAAWYCLFPSILRAFAHDYVDGIALSYAVIGAACIFTARPQAFLQHLTGGFFFALAFNAYPLSAIVPASLALPWLMLRRKVDGQANIVAAASAAAGFAAAYAIIAMLLWYQFTAVGKPFEVLPVSAMYTLSIGGASAVWQVGLGQIFLGKGEFFKILPVFLGVALLGGWWWSRRSDPSPDGAVDRAGMLLFAVLCAAVTAIFLLLHFGLKGAAISVPWGYLFALPSCGLAGLFLANLLTPRGYEPHVCAAGLVILTGAALWPHAADYLVAIARPVWLLTGLAVAAAALVPVFPKAPALRVAALAGLLLSPLGFFDSAFGWQCGFGVGQPAGKARLGSYEACMDQTGAFGAERDLRHGIFQLLDDVDAQLPEGVAPGLWYANETGYADEVGSAFLWQYSRVASVEKGDPGMPVINGFAREKIDGYGYLVLIGRSPAEVERGLRALAAAGYPTEPVLSRQAGGPAFSFTYEIVRKSAP